MRKKNPMCNRCGVVPHPPLTRYCRKCKREYQREWRARQKLKTPKNILSTVKQSFTVASQSGQ